jgi:hypothetical protein
VLGFAGTLAILRGNPQIGALIEVPAGPVAPVAGTDPRLWRRYDPGAGRAVQRPRAICTARSPRGRAAG